MTTVVGMFVVVAVERIEQMILVGIGFVIVRRLVHKIRRSPLLDYSSYIE
jgi:hypothetical protein